MSKIRVLIVDDAVVVRRLLSDAVAADPNMEVAGIASNGKIALGRIPQVNPDVVTLDIEMPEMDGLETLKEIRKVYPRLPVIMFSTLTERGAASTMDALQAGASDYVTKPANVGSVGLAIQRITDELIPKIKAICHRVAAEQSSSGQPAAILSVDAPRPAIPTASLFKASTPDPGKTQGRVRPICNRIEAIAIGVSTGGPNALAELIPALPADLPVPVFITQHMPPVFTRILAERLNAKSNIRVREGAPGMVAEPGFAYVAPGNFHMTAEREGTQVVLQLNQDPPENSCRPAVDPMFRSVVKAYHGSCLGVILTGMGQDGLRGCEKIFENGGQILAQDEATSVVWGMPGAIARANLAEKLLPLQEIAVEITRRAFAGRSRRPATSPL